MQLTALAHDTPSRMLLYFPTLGLGLIVQVLPFQDSISVLSGGREALPTATQRVVLVHEIRARSNSVPGGIAMETSVQLTPFHDSITGPTCGVYAVDTHQLGLVHEMEPRTTPFAGPGSIDQVDPFHTSTREFVEVPAEVLPTAMQNAEAVQEMLVKPRKFAGSENGTTDHPVPSHDSINPPALNAPTAIQNVEPMHEMSPRALPPTGLGLGVENH